MTTYTVYGVTHGFGAAVFEFTIVAPYSVDALVEAQCLMVAEEGCAVGDFHVALADPQPAHRTEQLEALLTRDYPWEAPGT